MFRIKRIQASDDQDYREVPAKPSVYTMIVVILIAALPLGWLNLRIGTEGSKIADTSNYRQLVSAVQSDVQTLRSIIDQAHIDEKSLNNSLAPAPTLIIPNIKIRPAGADENAIPNDSGFNPELNAIYWSVKDPIVTINDENYRVGDRIQGYQIMEIRETEVVFEDPMGEKITLNFYDYLN